MNSINYDDVEYSYSTEIERTDAGTVISIHVERADGGVVDDATERRVIDHIMQMMVPL
jgi:hypothetical protein